jgi:hypothetical protein
MTTTPPAYRAYLLRLWRTAEGQWRASVEDAHTGERQAFASLGQLAAFLAHATGAGSDGNRAGQAGLKPDVGKG